MKNIMLYWRLGSTFLKLEDFPITSILPEMKVIENTLKSGKNLKVKVIDVLLQNAKKGIIEKSKNKNAEFDEDESLFLTMAVKMESRVEYEPVKLMKLSILERMLLESAFGIMKAKVYDFDGNIIDKEVGFRFFEDKEAFAHNQESAFTMHEKEIRFNNVFINLFHQGLKVLRLRHRKHFVRFTNVATYKWESYVPVFINGGHLIAINDLHSVVHKTYFTIKSK